MHELTSSHKTLRIRVYGDESKSNLFVSCLEPEYIAGPVEWNNCRIEIETAILPSGDNGVLITDKQNDVRVLGRSFGIYENVKYGGQIGSEAGVGLLRKATFDPRMD